MTINTVRRNWLVIGGGISGISCVGQLISRGKTVAWVDPVFEVGRMGACYKTVPANTPNHVLCAALFECSAFGIHKFIDFKSKSGERTIFDSPGNGYSNLGKLVLPMKHATAQLHSDETVTTIRGRVQRLCHDSAKNGWTSEIVCSDGRLTSVMTDAVIAATGSSPTEWPYMLPNMCHDLDVMLCSDYCKRVVSDTSQNRNKPWAVVGSSHSAMLVVKNLLDAGVNSVVNFFRNDFLFEEYIGDGLYRNRGSGLKGPVGDWVRSSIPHKRLTRIRVCSDKDLSQWLAPFDSRVVFAIGFTRDFDPLICIDGLDGRVDVSSYDTSTGEIYDKSFFGIGIAFPQNYINGDGKVEGWVGFNRSLQQAKSIVSLHHSDRC